MNKLLKPASNPILIVLSVLAVVGEVFTQLILPLVRLFIYGQSLSGGELLVILLQLVIGVTPLLLLTLYAFVRCFTGKFDCTLQLAHGSLLLLPLLGMLIFEFFPSYYNSYISLQLIIGVLGVGAMVLGFEKIRTRSLAAMMAAMGMVTLLAGSISVWFEIFDFLEGVFHGYVDDDIVFTLLNMLLQTLMTIAGIVKYAAWIVAGTGRRAPADNKE